jgi:hypothetical protein
MCGGGGGAAFVKGARPSCYAGFNFRPTRPGPPSSARCATFSIPVGIKILKLFLRAHLLIVSQSFVKPSCATRFAQNSLSSAKEASSLKEDTSISTPALFTNFIYVIIHANILPLKQC